MARNLKVNPTDSPVKKGAKYGTMIGGVGGASRGIGLGGTIGGAGAGAALGAGVGGAYTAGKHASSAARGAVGKATHFVKGIGHAKPNRAGVGNMQSPKGAMHSRKTNM